MRTSRRLTRSLPVLGLAAVLALTGCSSTTSDGRGPGNGPGGPTKTGPQSQAASPVPSQTSGVPTPDTTETAALIAALTAIDPNLTVDDTEAVSDATTLCSSLRDGDDAATAVPLAFPDAQLDATQQQAVVDAVTTNFCTLDGVGGSSSAAASATPSTS